MTIKIPRHYSSLVLAREWFETGLPMLMYHKLGAMPSGVRIRGLYVSAAAFRKQLDELRMAGYSSGSLDTLADGYSASARKIVISFDDGFLNTLQYGLEALQQTGFQAIQYIIAGAIGGRNEWDIRNGEAPEMLMDKNQIREWLAGGQHIGSHSLGHVRLTEIPLAQAREEIIASKKQLEDSFGVPIRHFCYPYGAWSPEIRDLVMEAGYTTACTVDKGINTQHSHHHELQRVMVRTPSLQDRFASGFARLQSALNTVASR